MGSIRKGAHPLGDEPKNEQEYDYGLLNKSGNKEYQDSNKPCTNLLEHHTNMSQRRHSDISWLPIIKFHIIMAQIQNNQTHWHLTPTEEFYKSNLIENRQTGMNKQESRQTRGVIEKIIITSSYIIVIAIVIYCDILSVCSFLGASAGPPEPASEQYIVISPVIKDTIIIEFLTFSKEEQFHSLFVYWYYVIMFELRYIKEGIDSRIFNHYIYIDGYYLTPIMTYILNNFYKNNRAYVTESFEDFFKRALPSGKKFKDYFNKDEISKIRSTKSKITPSDRFDVTLLNKCIHLCVELCIGSVAHSISVDYKEIQKKSKEIKDIRNDMYHNPPKQDNIQSKKYYNNLKELEHLLNDLVNLLKLQFPSLELDDMTKNMYRRFFQAKNIPLSDFEMILISIIIIFVLITILLLYYLYNLTN